MPRKFHESGATITPQGPKISDFWASALVSVPPGNREKNRELSHSRRRLGVQTPLRTRNYATFGLQRNRRNREFTGKSRVASCESVFWGVPKSPLQLICGEMEKTQRLRTLS